MTSTPEDLGELVARVAREIRRRSRRDLPLPPHQFRALRVIGREPLRPGLLAETLGVTPRAATDVIDLLASEDLVAVHPDPADRRAKLVSVTPRGQRYLDDTRAARAAISAELFATLSDAERAELGRLLARVVDAA